ncbi:MAG: ABC transporter permease [Patescibacteria group bacterium]|nr:ABC transporter permease [Patescibacteria group bacterium]
MRKKNIKDNLLVAWAISKKDIKIYYFKPGTLMFGIMFPLFMFFAFAVGRSMTPAILIPGLLSLTVLFSASSVGPVAIPTERRVKTFERLVSAPISLYAIILGKALGGVLFSLFVSLVTLLGAWAFLGVVIANPLILALGLALASLCFSLLGIMFAMFPTENPGNVMMVLNFIRLPLMFISGIFIPIETLPSWGKLVSFLSPLTYANDLFRFGIEGKAQLDLVVNFIILLIFAGIFLFIGIRLDKKFRQ